MSDETTAKVCPRCGHEHLEVLYESPVSGVWTVMQCQTCLYSWRTSEPLRRSDRAHYPEPFQMSENELTHAEAIPPVPPLRRQED